MSAARTRIPLHPLTGERLANFTAKVSATPSGCWQWTGATSSGYGSFWPGGVSVRAHRQAWVNHHGRDVPERAVVVATCGNRLCVRPDHLRLADHPSPGKRTPRCSAGHRMDPENTYTYPAGSRRAGRVECRACRANRGRERAAAAAAAPQRLGLWARLVAAFRKVGRA